MKFRKIRFLIAVMFAVPLANNQAQQVGAIVDRGNE